MILLHDSSLELIVVSEGQEDEAKRDSMHVPSMDCSIRTQAVLPGCPIALADNLSIAYRGPSLSLLS